MVTTPTLCRHLIAALALAASTLTPAHAQLSVQWITQYGSSDIDDAFAITVDAAGQSWVAGGTYGVMGAASAGSRDLFLSRLSTSGSVDFTRQHGGTALDAGFGVALVGSGTVFAGGYASSSSVDGVATLGGNDALSIRYGTTGSWQQTTRIGSTSDDVIYGMDGNATNLLTGGTAGGSFDGNTHAGNVGEPDAFISLRNSSGALVWTRFVSTSAFDIGLDVAFDSTGNGYLAGYTSGTLPGNSSGGRLLLARYDTAGNRTLLKQLGPGGSEEARGVAADASGNIYLTGFMQGNLGGKDAFVMKLDSLGAVLWTQFLGGSFDDQSEAIALDGAGHIWVAGSSSSTFGGHINSGGRDAFVAEYDAAGNLLGTTFLATTSHENIEDIAIGPDGAAYVTGWTLGLLGGTQAGSSDIFVAKITSVPEPSTTLLLAGFLFPLLLRLRTTRGSAH